MKSRPVMISLSCSPTAISLLLLVLLSVKPGRITQQLASKVPDDGWHHAIRHDCKITDIRPFPPLTSICDAGSEAVLVENDLEGARRERQMIIVAVQMPKKMAPNQPRTTCSPLGSRIQLIPLAVKTPARNQQGQPFPSGGCEPEWAWKLCEQGGRRGPWGLWG